MCKNIPRLYGLIKTHKSNNLNGIPITAVVTFVGSPTYKLSCWLNCILKKKIKPQFKHTVNNSKEYIDKSRNVVIWDNCLVFSLDVKNFNTKVPKWEVPQLVKNVLYDSSLNGKESVEATFERGFLFFFILHHWKPI